MSLPFDTLKPRGSARIIDHGCSGIVSIYMTDERFVLKGYEVWLDERCYGKIGNIDSNATLTLEDAIYRHTDSLKLERALGNLRKLILECPPPTEQTRLKMVIQIACGMAHMHSKIVFHCDFSCRNVFVFEDWLLKIGDFGGTRYQLPLRGRDWESVDDTKREIFALGCGIYEIMAWKAPFSELIEEQVVEKYANKKFPATDSLLVGNVIHACWNEKLEAAVDVEMALREKLVGI
ncbi:kinase-like domain-containing protein [Rhexocercosporidium sp. MPI-PUGE-AT-0058]|nr:kinase-like domain-containing protein [Rhexocercosporidium sp. MPI-PUGE-AT-0058]